MKALFIFFAIATAHAAPPLINGLPAGDKFPGVGTFNMGCTFTKVGKFQYLTAAHCVSAGSSSLRYSFNSGSGSLPVKSLHIHPSWIKDCEKFHCSGKEVGGPNMTPGRADVALFVVTKETPEVPVVNINFEAVLPGTEVFMVGAGCTRGLERGGRGKMRYGTSRSVDHKALEHQHSLYRSISEITAQANVITPGYLAGENELSLCPGDSGGPLLIENEKGEHEIVGIAADYTFNGPYRDGELTVTNLHTRLDDDSHHKIGEWIRSVWNK